MSGNQPPAAVPLPHTANDIVTAHNPNVPVPVIDSSSSPEDLATWLTLASGVLGNVTGTDFEVLEKTIANNRLHREMLLSAKSGTPGKSAGDAVSEQFKAKDLAESMKYVPQLRRAIESAQTAVSRSEEDHKADCQRQFKQVAAETRMVMMMIWESDPRKKKILSALLTSQEAISVPPMYFWAVALHEFERLDAGKSPTDFSDRDVLVEWGMHNIECEHTIAHDRMLLSDTSISKDAAFIKEYNAKYTVPKKVKAPKTGGEPLDDDEEELSVLTRIFADTVEPDPSGGEPYLPVLQLKNNEGRDVLMTDGAEVKAALDDVRALTASLGSQIALLEEKMSSEQKRGADDRRQIVDDTVREFRKLQEEVDRIQRTSHSFRGLAGANQRDFGRGYSSGRQPPRYPGSGRQYQQHRWQH